MGLESSFNFIDDLVTSNPAAGDNVSAGDDHLRGIKSAVKGSFTSLGSAAVTATAAEINVMDGITKTTAELNASASLVQSTAIATTSGTTADFTGLPSWVKKVTIGFDLVSTDSASWNLNVVIGDSGGFEITGYFNVSNTIDFANTHTHSAPGTNFTAAVGQIASATASGVMVLVNTGSNAWSMSSDVASFGAGAQITHSAGAKTLSGTLTQIRVQTSAGLFDGGQVNIIYEG